MAQSAEHIEFHLTPNVEFKGLRSRESVVFFGNNLGVLCQRCGAYEQTSRGHKYCAHVSCPIAMIEVQRRRRKRTSRLERVYVPLLLKPAAKPPATD